MIRRYDLTRSDNYPRTGRKAYPCSGNGDLFVTTNFPVKSVLITWSSIPLYNGMPDYSSSSLSSNSSSSVDSSSSSSSTSNSSISSYSTSSSSNSSSSFDSSSSSSNSSSSFSSLSSISGTTSSLSSSSVNSFSSLSSLSSESISSLTSESEFSSDSTSLSSDEYKGDFFTPRIYVLSAGSTGFTIRYENIPEEIGYIEFSYIVF